MYSACYESVCVCFTGRRFSIVNWQESEMALWLLVVVNRDHFPRHVCRNHPSCYWVVNLMALACQYILLLLIFSHGTTAPCGPEPPHCRGFTITLRHTTLSRTALNEWSARRRDLYPSTYSSQETDFHAPGGISTHNPSRRAALDRAATGIGYHFILFCFWFCCVCSTQDFCGTDPLSWPFNSLIEDWTGRGCSPSG